MSMALSSQMSRTGLTRRHRAGGRGRHHARRWPWVVMVVGVVAVIGLIQWLSSGDSQPRHADAAIDAATTQTDDSASSAPPQVSASAAQPNVPSLTLGANRANASASGSTGSTPPTPGNTDGRNSQPQPTGPSPAGAAPAAPLVTTLDASRNSTASAATVLRQGMDLIADGRLVEGRRNLSELLFARSAELSPLDAQTVRDTLSSINKEMVFSPKLFPGDPLAEAYRVQPGDMLSRIASRAKVPYPFLERINRIDARRLQAGQTIKVINGPFHARVIKSDYRMDLYLREDGGTPIYITSLPVGLGEADSTPLGEWIIEPGRKVKNPAWSNPRTGEFFAAGAANNPIGSYWLALRGITPETENIRGYGIHGTIEPESVGRQMSMGCIRLRDEDIELVFNMLVEGDSTVQILR
jgi:lipoprotein-anchoring transpeptidase ErfK/SrfK